MVVASFQAKIGWKRLKKIKNKKNTIMALFQAKIGWKK